jgi:hypothetical protein
MPKTKNEAIEEDVNINEVTESKHEELTPKEVNLDEKVTVRNIAGWDVGFARLSDMRGDVIVPANGSVRLSRNEIIMQTQNGNRLFLGTDTIGSHATLYIEDEYTRVEVEFDSIDGKRKQDVLTDEKVRKMFEIKSDKSFEDSLSKNIVTRAEKFALIKIVEKLKFNDYSKMKLIEKYTGYKFA